MKDNPQLQHDNLPIWLALKIKFEELQASNTSFISSAIRPRYQNDPHDDVHSEGENSAKMQKTSGHGTYMFRESSSGQINESEPGPSTSDNQEQLDDFDFWTDSYATDDDELLTKKHKNLWKKCHRQLMRQNYAKFCQGDPKAPALSLVNQDLLYLKKGNSGPEKIVLSQYKFLAVPIPDDDIKERTSRWELGREHKFITKIIARRANGSIVSITKSDYKNLNKNDIKDLYLLIVNGKVDDYVETGLLWSLSVFIRSTVIWERVHHFHLGVEIYQQKVKLTALKITFPGIEKHKMFFIVIEPVYGIIYKNNKKEKSVMRHQEAHKLCNATLKRVLEGLKSYNNNMKHGYVTPSLSKEYAEYLQLFEEEIEERLKHRD
ncbi:hypothetical protein Tco_0660856 [Tanacetum coccineum]